jgi:DegV family protein with EDD domain
VFDSCQVSSAQGLLAVWAAEAAQQGHTPKQILAGLDRMRDRTSVYAIVPDISFAVRGGRVPRVAQPLTRLLRVSLVLRSLGKGKLSLMGGLWGRRDLPERFARSIARRLDPSRRYRLVVGHCDCPEDARRVEAALVAAVRSIDRLWVLETGIAIGAHAGPGSLVIGVQDYEPPAP